MVIEYTGRQTVVTQKYKVQAEAGLARVATILGEGNCTAAHIILTVDKYRHIAEVTLTGCGHSAGIQSIVARCEGAEMKAALHDALEKIEQQAIRRRQRTTTAKRHPKAIVKLAEMASVAEAI
jgi:putative sigma-54 modulation protein